MPDYSQMTDPTKWRLEIHHIDVGRGERSVGDATLFIATYEGEVARTVLIDGGNRENKSYPVKRYLKAHLKRNDYHRLDLAVVTHYDKDHFLGIIGLLKLDPDQDEGKYFKDTSILDQGIPRFASVNFDGEFKFLLELDQESQKDQQNRIGPFNKYKTWDYNNIYDQLTQRTRLFSDYERYAIYIKKYHPGKRISANVDGGIGKDKDGVVKLIENISQNQLDAYVLLGQDVFWHNVSPPPQGAPKIILVAANQYVLQPDDKVKLIQGSSGDYRNENSLAFLVEFNHFRYYIGGDLTSYQEDGKDYVNGPKENFSTKAAGVGDYLTRNQQTVQVMKTSHHGSAHSTSIEFLNKLKPRTAIISCGPWNNFPHPEQQVITNLEYANFRRSKYGLNFGDCDLTIFNSREKLSAALERSELDDAIKEITEILNQFGAHVTPGKETGWGEQRQKILDFFNSVSLKQLAQFCFNGSRDPKSASDLAFNSIRREILNLIGDPVYSYQGVPRYYLTGYPTQLTNQDQFLGYDEAILCAAGDYYESKRGCPDTQCTAFTDDASLCTKKKNICEGFGLISKQFPCTDYEQDDANQDDEERCKYYQNDCIYWVLVPCDDSNLTKKGSKNKQYCANVPKRKNKGRYLEKGPDVSTVIPGHIRLMVDYQGSSAGNPQFKMVYITYDGEKYLRRTDNY